MIGTGNPTNATTTSGGIPLNLRPVIFVVNATLPPVNSLGASLGRSSSRNSLGGGNHANRRAGGGAGRDDFSLDQEEPFDERRTSIESSDVAATNKDRHDDNDEDVDKGAGDTLFDTFLSALQGRPYSSSININDSMDVDNDESSYASSAPFSPERKSSIVGPGDSDSSSLGFAFPSPIRRLSPFSRLKVPGRWKNNKTLSSPNANEVNPQEDSNLSQHAAHETTYSLAQDIMEDDPDDITEPTISMSGTDNISSALNIYSNEQQPANFLSKRARIVAVSRRHAFPPSKCPKGKLQGDDAAAFNAATSTNNSSWIQSYDLQSEGVLPSGWLEKHARALPSSLVVVTTLKESSLKDISTNGKLERHVVRAVEDLRMTLAEKRNVPIHLVCLMKYTEEEEIELKQQHQKQRGGNSGGGGQTKKNKQQFNMLKEKICQECYLPQSQVSILRYPIDLEPDQWETALLRSPYLPGAPPMPGSDGNADDATKDNSQSPAGSTMMMNPLLRQLDRSLRDSSALYYSQLADHQEKKLALWRNRYTSTNSSFVVNTTLAAMRCARYAMKVATLREFQMRTGGRLSWTPTAGGVATIDGGGSNISGSASRWTDKGSLPMRYYEETYGWLIELHRRAISWRAAPVGGDKNAIAPPPMTPGNSNAADDVSQVSSPKYMESPGGGMGVELSFPMSPGMNETPRYPSTLGGTYAPPPPPPVSVGTTPHSQSKTSMTQTGLFFTQLWEQCRAVAGVVNAKLLRSASTTSATEAEDQWRRHRLVFLSSPQNIPDFHPSQNDNFFGPAWHRVAYATGELLTFACIAEGRWRRSAINSSEKGNLTSALSLFPSYHQPLAPWKAYGDLAEAMLRLGREIEVESAFQKQEEINSSKDLDSPMVLGRRRFVGSIASGESGVGTMQWLFDNESFRDHRAMALEYILHALDILEENYSLCPQMEGMEISVSASAGGSYNPPDSSARLHYLAGRLLMSLGNPIGALAHFKISSTQTKKWPSLNLAIQRSLSICVECCKKEDKDVHSNSGRKADSKDASIEMLLRPDLCKLLSANEKARAQLKAWEADSSTDTQHGPREVIWNDDENGEAKSPFEFAVSFAKSTHATSSDKVLACVSIKSCLDSPVIVESIQLITTSGLYDVPNADQCAKSSLFQSKEGKGKNSSSTKRNFNQGVQFDANNVAYFLTELPLPSDLSAIALGKSSVDLSKFIPKNGRLCNMGYTHAAGNICESRSQGDRQQISLSGKPVTISSLGETSQLFLGGIPLVCHGVVLTLKPLSGDSGTRVNTSLRLTIDRQHMISPLGRSGAQRLIMEESNYMAHSWSRPSHHPWCLGPSCLRVLGPRPQLEVTNLSDTIANGKAIKGTVNRMVFRLEAGDDHDCHDVRVWLRCKSNKISAPNENTDEIPSGDAANNIDPNLTPLFVLKSTNPTLTNVTENGITLPQGWETRRDVAMEESNEVSTVITPHLEAGKSYLFALDLFCPLSMTPVSAESPVDSDNFSTAYEVIIEYRQTRSEKEVTEESGDHVMVMHSGSITWISPFSAEFFLTNGPQKPFPGGVQHYSNTVTKSALKNASPDQFEIIAADGELIQMRCAIGANGMGDDVAAKIHRVCNESEIGLMSSVLYSPDDGNFMNRLKKGSKLSLSYAIAPQRSTLNSNENVTIPLGIVSVEWKPVSLSLPDESIPNGSSFPKDDYGFSHGPLCLPDVAPIKFYGPQCHVLNAPFSAKLVHGPSAPKVGTPFRVSYQITNRTAKSQSLLLSMNDSPRDDSQYPSDNQLLVTGKMKTELQIAPFEEKSISFTFMSMVAGKVIRPPLCASSGRHQSWVINENESNARFFFVLP